MYKDGTEIYASCDMYDVSGPLVGDHEDLDGVVTLRDELEGKVVRINAWLWTIEVVDPPPPRAE